MKVEDPNLAMVEFVADALGQLRDELVFVGGCAAGLLITDPGRAPIRATDDVDLIAEVASSSDFYPLQDRLLAAGFRHDQEVICRWRYQGVKVDVMPTAEGILGFTNQWYNEAVRTSTALILPSGKKILLATAPLIVATKIEAFHDRGEGDFQGSHDLEDIISIFDGRESLVEEIDSSSTDVKEYLSDEIDGLLGNPMFVDAVRFHMRPDPASQERVPRVIHRLRRIAGI